MGDNRLNFDIGSQTREKECFSTYLKNTKGIRMQHPKHQPQTKKPLGPKTARDHRQAQEVQKGMDKNSKTQRLNQKVILKVLVDSKGVKGAAIVEVIQEGQPHPKGVSARIIDSGKMNLDGNLDHRIKDAAMNFFRGRAHEFDIQQLQENQLGNGTGRSEDKYTSVPDHIPGN